MFKTMVMRIRSQVRHWLTFKSFCSPFSGGYWVTDSKGYPEIVLWCPCGRMHPVQHDLQSTGLPIAKLEFLGWRNREGTWWCPYCTKANKSLMEIANYDD